MSIDPTTLDGLTLSLTGSVFQGPEGPQGKDGKAGANGTPGKNIEFQATPTYIQWRYVGDTLWNNLIAVASITGPAGQDGIGIKVTPVLMARTELMDRMVVRSNYRRPLPTSNGGMWEPLSGPI